MSQNMRSYLGVVFLAALFAPLVVPVTAADTFVCYGPEDVPQTVTDLWKDY